MALVTNHICPTFFPLIMLNWHIGSVMVLGLWPQVFVWTFSFFGIMRWLCLAVERPFYLIMFLVFGSCLFSWLFSFSCAVWLRLVCVQSSASPDAVCLISVSFCLHVYSFQCPRVKFTCLSLGFSMCYFLSYFNRLLSWMRLILLPFFMWSELLPCGD